MKRTKSAAAISASSGLEILIAAALGLAALGGAFAAYRNEQHNHKASELFSEAVRDFDQAGQYYASGNATLTRDQSLYLEYAKARVTSDPKLASYIFENLMSSTLQAAVRWVQSAANLHGVHPTRTPFSSADPHYRLAALGAGQQRTELSDERFNQAKLQQEDADHFTLVEVVLAISLFLYGIAGVSSGTTLKLGTLGSGLVVFVLAVILLLAT